MGLRARQDELGQLGPIVGRWIEPVMSPRSNGEDPIVCGQNAFSSVHFYNQAPLSDLDVLFLVRVEMEGWLLGANFQKLRVLQVENNLCGEGAAGNVEVGSVNGAIKARK
jgi:hypothetical protein